MILDLKRLHEICCLLHKLNSEYYHSHRDLYLEEHKHAFFMSYCNNEEEFDKFIYNGFKIDDKYICILDTEEKLCYIDAWVPISLLDMTDIEIEEWYKKELENICEYEAEEEELSEVDERILELEKELKELKQLKNEINTSCNN